jgi:hypothetical protein
MSHWIRPLVISGGVIVGGWALINYITPTREELLEVVTVHASLLYFG